MSQENVDFIREVFHAFTGADLAALAGLLDPDIQWKAVEDPEPKHGFDGVLESLGAWYEVWDEVHVELEELIDGGADIVAVVNMRGRHAESRSEVTERFFQVWTIRAGKIAGFHEYKKAGRGPRSGGAVGVGDAAGERGDR